MVGRAGGKEMSIEMAKQDLFEIKEILDKLKIKFFLVHGTLLGAIREKNFIRGDIDIDLRMFAKDWFLGICKHFKVRNFNCTVVKRYPDKVAKLKLTKRVQTDLMLEYCYPLENVYIVLSMWHYDRSVITPAEYYKEDCFINFLGKQFRVPDKAEDLLRLIYGDNWMTSVEERIVSGSPPCQSWHKHWKKINMKKYVEWIEKHPKEI